MAAENERRFRQFDKFEESEVCRKVEGFKRKRGTRYVRKVDEKLGAITNTGNTQHGNRAGHNSHPSSQTERRAQQRVNLIPKEFL
jgi:hypothetical protein